VQADLDDEASLARAFAGAHGAFCMTNFWEHFSPEREKAQAANLARAAHEAGVAHVVWSTLEDVRNYVPAGDERIPTLEGGYKVPHMDAKAEANEFFREAGVPTTFLHTSFYWDNMITFGMGPQRMSDGALAITFPLGDAKLPGIAAEDIGACAYGVFQRGECALGRTVSIAGEHLTGHEMAAGLSRALGTEVAYNAISPDAYRAAGFPGADDLGNMFQFKADFQEAWCGPRSVARSRELHPGLQSFDDWLARNADRIPVPVAA
jgi:uncharacterized protein YbjT (DUF2867 family)